jgi:hypothetical protein
MSFFLWAAVAPAGGGVGVHPTGEVVLIGGFDEDEPYVGGIVAAGPEASAGICYSEVLVGGELEWSPSHGLTAGKVDLSEAGVDVGPGGVLSGTYRQGNGESGWYSGVRLGWVSAGVGGPAGL